MSVGVIGRVDHATRRPSRPVGGPRGRAVEALREVEQPRPDALVLDHLATLDLGVGQGHGTLQGALLERVEIGLRGAGRIAHGVMIKPGASIGQLSLVHRLRRQPMRNSPLRNEVTPPLLDPLVPFRKLVAQKLEFLALLIEAAE